MKPKEFLNKHVKSGSEFLAGIVNIDLVSSSKLIGADRDLANTKAAFKKLIDEQLLYLHACILCWGGDGGKVLFDISNGCDELLIFADRINHLFPYFNSSRGTLNFLPLEQDVLARIVCHAGNLINKNGTPGNISGPAINAMKNERAVGLPGNVVLSSEVVKRISVELRDRCEFSKEHRGFGKVFVLDKNISISQIRYCSKNSRELKNWIKNKVSQDKYDSLQYFAYTNELLFQFLGYEISGVSIRIIARNWTDEQKDEDLYNKQITNAENGNGLTRRLWKKSELIHLRAKETVEGARDYGKNIDMRFYDLPPIFNGAILTGKNIEPCGFIGVSKWEECPTGGGSPYKLEEWPGIILDGRINNHKYQLMYLQSRFEEFWSKGKTYDEVCKSEFVSISDIGKIWDMDQRYLIIFPRRIHENHVYPYIYPYVNYEDVMAFHLFKDFLERHGISAAQLDFQVPNTFDGDWIPKDDSSAITCTSPTHG